MSGTDLAHSAAAYALATRCPRKHRWPRSRAPQSSPPSPSLRQRYAIALRTHYAVPGTDLRGPTRCPVLTSAMRLPGPYGDRLPRRVVQRPCRLPYCPTHPYAIPGTDAALRTGLSAYAAPTPSPVLI
eukprot:2379522-Rhodomonas_salina.2